MWEIANAPGASTWAAAHAKAVALVNKMTIEEKSNITTGYTPSRYGCSGMTGAVTRLGFPGMCLHDAGNGVKNTDFVNAWPSGLHAGASWNRELTYDRGLYMGGEFKTKGVNVAMGPVVGPLGRIAADGRTWEGFASDRLSPLSTLWHSRYFLAKKLIKNSISLGSTRGRNCSGSPRCRRHCHHQTFHWQ